MYVENKRMILQLVNKEISVTRLISNEPVTINVLTKIAEYPDCRIEDLRAFVK